MMSVENHRSGILQKDSVFSVKALYLFRGQVVSWAQIWEVCFFILLYGDPLVLSHCVPLDRGWEGRGLGAKHSSLCK